MHTLLRRQLKRYLGLDLESNGPPQQDLKALIEAVDAAYQQAEADRRLLERSLELMSKELVQRNDDLRKDLEQRQWIETELRQANEQLKIHMKHLEVLNRAMLGREDRILELKQELSTLRAKLGAPPTETS